MSVYAYDGAYARNLDQMVAGGAVAVSVYLTGNFAVPKSWVDLVHSRGLGVVLNYEQAADELVYAGFAGGEAAGQRAVAAALALGAPTDGNESIVFSVDVNVPTGAFASVGAAFDGINAALAGRFLANYYGEGALGEYLIATGRVKQNVKFWLSASSSFPGFNPASPHVALVQLVGSPVAGTDQDRFTDPAGIHAWWPASSPYGVDMPLTDAEKKQLIDGTVSALIPHMQRLAQWLGGYKNEIFNPQSMGPIPPGVVLNAGGAGQVAAAVKAAPTPALVLTDAHVQQIVAGLAPHLTSLTPEQLTAAVVAAAPHFVFKGASA